ncbi:MAG: hypothetical protein AAF492_12310 [Verrucomicrobiota bacterium]
MVDPVHRSSRLWPMVEEGEPALLHQKESLEHLENGPDPDGRMVCRSIDSLLEKTTGPASKDPTLNLNLFSELALEIAELLNKIAPAIYNFRSAALCPTSNSMNSPQRSYPTFL